MKSIEIVEVGPRDGFQSIKPFIPTATKCAFIDRLYDAGLRRVEATAFVSERAVPQMADAAIVLRHAQSLPDMDVQVLTPTASHARRAIDSGARHICFVLSVSREHNLKNVRREPDDSIEELRAIADAMPEGTRLRVNVATAFDCPYEGRIPASKSLELMERIVAIAPAAEVCLCDTTGRATPDRVYALFSAAVIHFSDPKRWAYHGHDTYGLGLANVLAACKAGVGVVDASFAGLGGCPFAPGATGNVATEDVVWALSQMDCQTGVDLDALLEIAVDGTKLPGAVFGGRIRAALVAGQA